MTQHFTLKEFTSSATAKRLGIDNTPPAAVRAKLKTLAQNVLEPLRKAWGKPIIVSSGYRCPRLNKAIGGAQNSDHLYGCAADIHTVSDTREDNKRLFDLALHLIHNGTIEVKQLIDESRYDWLHISWQDGRTKKRNQVLHL